jgi:GNAT superfamily N-acetyltransferase
MLDSEYFETMRWNTRIPGMVREADETFARYTTPHGSMRYILGNKLGLHVPTAQLDELIESEIAQAKRDGVGALTWRTHGRDACGQLPARLVQRGFVGEHPSTQCFASVAALAPQFSTEAAAGTINVRELTQPHEMDAYLPIWEQCFPGQDHQRYVNDYKNILASAEGGVRFFAAFDGGLAVASGYTFHNALAPMALLCGGATIPAYQRRGAYRALLARRVEAAREDGVHTLCVDASPNSAPILQKLGFVPNDSVVFYEMKFAA